MLLHDVQVCICIYPPCTSAAVAAAALQCVAILLLLQLLLLAAAVRQRVPDGKNCCRGSSHLIPLFLSLHSNTIYFPCTSWQYCCVALTASILYLLCISYHKSSVVTDMRGAKADGARRVPFYYFEVLLARVAVKIKAKYIMLNGKHVDCTEITGVV